MPIYEYECKECHRRTEKRQKFSDPEITECPHCGGPIARVLSAPAFSFAGGGWYKDLYSSAKPAASGAGAGESKGGEGGAAASGESKPESKAGDAGSAKKETAPSTTASAPASTAAPTGSGNK